MWRARKLPEPCLFGPGAFGLGAHPDWNMQPMQLSPVAPGWTTEAISCFPQKFKSGVLADLGLVAVFPVNHGHFLASPMLGRDD